MNQLNLSNHFYLSEIDSYYITNEFNKWRQMCNLNDENSVSINQNLFIESINYNTNQISNIEKNKYKYILRANYRGSYYNISEILLLIINIWKTRYFITSNKEEFEVCISDEIKSYSIYYTNVNHYYQFVFIFY
jgi:hypothetical protein